MRWISGLVFCLLLCGPGKAETSVVVRQDGATPTELSAANLLKETLSQRTGVPVYMTLGEHVPTDAIIVGPGALANRYFPEVDLSKVGPEELVRKTKGGRLLLAGGRPRWRLSTARRKWSA